MLNAQIISLRRQGKENVKHKPAIENENLAKLKASQAIAVTNPLSLLRNVWFHVVLFFCRRGREGQRELKRSSFTFEALDNMMKSISEAAKLSKMYTNHSVRATAITSWSNAGIQNRHIMAISGHRSEQSLAHYNTQPSTSQLQHCSEVLSSSL
ncbi:unnamed protein product, partial [Pocillopora meandrina]